MRIFLRKLAATDSVARSALPHAPRATAGGHARANAWKLHAARASGWTHGRRSLREEARRARTRRGAAALGASVVNGAGALAAHRDSSPSPPPPTAAAGSSRCAGGGRSCAETTSSQPALRTSCGDTPYTKSWSGTLSAAMAIFLNGRVFFAENTGLEKNAPGNNFFPVDGYKTATAQAPLAGRALTGAPGGAVPTRRRPAACLPPWPAAWTTSGAGRPWRRRLTLWSALRASSTSSPRYRIYSKLEGRVAWLPPPAPAAANLRRHFGRRAPDRSARLRLHVPLRPRSDPLPRGRHCGGAR